MQAVGVHTVCPELKHGLIMMASAAERVEIRIAMAVCGVIGLIRARYKAQTIDSNHSMPISDRLFKVEDTTTHPQQPDQVWAGDISYIHTGEGFLYLATWLDLFTHKVFEYSMNGTMETELILKDFHMAMGSQSIARGQLPIHSDRATQYASEEFRETMKLYGIPYGIKTNMPRRGNCWNHTQLLKPSLHR